MSLFQTIAILVFSGTSAVLGQFIRSIELTPIDVGSKNGDGSSNSATFSDLPTVMPQLYFGVDFGAAVKAIDFNTAPDGPLTEGGTVVDQYQSLGITFNSIRISADIFGGNSYGPGFATEDTKAHVFSFADPVIAAGFVSTSPGGDLVEFFSGPDATGDLLLSFNDRSSSTDLFLGGLAFEGATFRSIRITPNGSQVEIDELIFVEASPHLEPRILPIEFTPDDLGSASGSVFSVTPSDDHQLFFGTDFGDRIRNVDYNTAPDGALTEGLLVTNEYSSFGVTMNSIRISASIYGGNQYGTGFAAEHDPPQIYNFDPPVVAVGIINTSPDRDLIEFFSGPNATGDLLLSFRDTQGLPLNFNIDRFVGGIALNGAQIHSIRVSNNTGNLELDELAFVPISPAPQIAITNQPAQNQIRIDFTGILQSGASLNNFTDMDPQPASPLLLPYFGLESKMFFRSRTDSSP